MKFRADYVTNSSSSSFIAFGIDVNILQGIFTDEVKIDLVKKYASDEYVQKYLDEEEKEAITNNDEGYFLDWFDTLYDDDPDSIFETLFNLEETLLSYSCFSEAEIAWIGVPVTTLFKQENLQMKDIKSFVFVEFQKVFGDKVKLEDIEYIEEVWYS